MARNSNSHFTDLMITKDVYGNADFIFGVDMDRLAIDNSPYSALIANMTDVAKRQVASNSEILYDTPPSKKRTIAKLSRQPANARSVQ